MPNKTPQPQVSSFRHLNGILIILFLALRLLPILTAVERISHYDELDLGMIAKEWLRGSNLPMWQYQIDPYGGESIALSAVALPVVKLLGNSLFAVKIPSFFFAFLTFLLTVYWAKRFFGNREAFLTGLVLVFCPPSFVQFSLSGLSGHTEVLALSMAAFYFFYDAIWGTKRTLSFLLFGFFSGLSFWFFHQSLLLTFSCLLAWLCINRKTFFSFRLPFACVGCLAGLTPVFFYAFYAKAYNSSFILNQWEMMARNFAFINEATLKWISLFCQIFPASLSFFPVFGIHEHIFSWVSYVILLTGISLSLLSWNQKDAPAETSKFLPLFFYPLIFSVFFSLTSFSVAHDIGYIGYRYLSPLIFFALLLFSVLASRTLLTRGILMILLILGGMGQSALMLHEPFGRAFQYRGDSFFRVGTQWFYSLFPVVGSADDLSVELAKRQRWDAYYLGWGLADTAARNQVNSLLHEETRVIPFNEIVNLLPQSFYPFFYEYLGVLLGEDHYTLATLRAKYPESVIRYIVKGYIEKWGSNQGEKLLSCPECLEAEYGNSEWFYRTLGENYFFQIESDPKSYDALGEIKQNVVEALLARIRSLPFSQEKKNLIFAGIALGHLRTSWDSNTLMTQSLRAFLSVLKPEERSTFYWGIGWIARSIHREDRIRAVDGLRDVPESFQKNAEDGLIAFENWYGIKT